MIGRLILQPIFHPIGFNLEMIVALVPGMAAREAAVSSLGLIYSLGEVDETSSALHDAAGGAVDAADGSELHRLVRLCAAMLRDAGDGEARDELRGNGPASCSLTWWGLAYIASLIDLLDGDLGGSLEHIPS